MTVVQLSHGRIADANDSFENTSKEGIPLSPRADKGVKGMKFKQTRIIALRRMLCRLVPVLQLSHRLRFDPSLVSGGFLPVRYHTHQCGPPFQITSLMQSVSSHWTPWGSNRRNCWLYVGIRYETVGALGESAEPQERQAMVIIIPAP